MREKHRPLFRGPITPAIDLLLFYCVLVALTVIAFSTVLPAQERPAVAPLTVTELPIGSYTSHSTTLQSQRFVDLATPGSLQRAIDRRARAMRQFGNVAWITDMPADADVVAYYVRTFRSHGMEIVAGSGEWYAYAGRPDAYTRLRAVYDALPADARPWCWSLGDETAPGDIATLGTLAQSCLTGGVPATMTQVPEYHAATMTSLGNRCASVTCDYYPFFKPGLNTNPPYGDAALLRFSDVCRTTTARCVALGVQPHIMTQGYGDSTLYQLPTPAQTEWQIWRAYLQGARGVYVFAAGAPSPNDSDPPPPSLLQWNVPGADELITAQGQAVASVYSRVPAVAPWFRGGTVQPAPVTTTTLTAGDLVTVLRTPDGRRLLAVLADPNRPARTHVVRLPGVTRVTPLAQSATPVVTMWPSFWSLIFPTLCQVTVTPGTVWLGEIR